MWLIPCKMTNSSSKPLQTLGKWYQPRNPPKKTNLFKKKILKLSHTLLLIIVLRLVAGKSHHSFIILTSNCASHHNACKFSFFISADGSAPAALASLLFDPPEPQNIWKKQCFATFLPFRAPWSCFFWLFLFSDILSSSLLLVGCSHLCFFICPYCRKFGF